MSRLFIFLFLATFGFAMTGCEGSGDIDAPDNVAPLSAEEQAKNKEYEEQMKKQYEERARQEAENR